MSTRPTKPDDEKSEKSPEDWIAAMAREHYNTPPPTPRREIWARIESGLRTAEGEDGGGGRDPGAAIPLRRHAVPGPWWLALAATAVLAAGVGIGRWSRPAPSVLETTASAAETAGRGNALGRMVALEHLSDSEPLLAMVRAEAARGGMDAEVGRWARTLLGETRFLLDSGIALEPEVRSILEDLELILLQAALLGEDTMDEDRGRSELALLAEGMDERNVLSRIQAVVPTAGTGMTGI